MVVGSENTKRILRVRGAYWELVVASTAASQLIHARNITVVVLCIILWIVQLQLVVCILCCVCTELHVWILIISSIMHPTRRTRILVLASNIYIHICIL